MDVTDMRKLRDNPGIKWFLEGEDLCASRGAEQSREAPHVASFSSESQPEPSSKMGLELLWTDGLTVSMPLSISRDRLNKIWCTSSKTRPKNQTF